MFTLLALSAAAFAGDTQTECRTYMPSYIDAVSNTDGHTTPNDLYLDGWEPTPLLYTSIYVSGDEKGNPSCVVAQLSLHNYRGIGQDYTAVQVLIDDGITPGLTPMYGHLTGCAIKGISDSEACTLFPHGGQIPGHSYGFQKMVTPGWHRVVVYYAGFDTDPDPNNPNPPGTYSGGANLAVHHQ